MKLLPSNPLSAGYRVTAASLVLLALSGVSSAKPSNSSDPCAAIAGKQTAGYNEAKACLDYFPFNKTIADQTIETVRKVANELYVFNVKRRCKLPLLEELCTKKRICIALYRKLLQLLHSTKVYLWFLSTSPTVSTSSKTTSGTPTARSRMRSPCFSTRCTMLTWHTRRFATVSLFSGSLSNSTHLSGTADLLSTLHTSRTISGLKQSSPGLDAK